MNLQPAKRAIHMLLATLVLTAVTHLSVAQDQQTASVYAAYKDRVLQIRVVDENASSKAGIGSGFLVSADGWVASNYHVISHLVTHPGRYRAEYVHDNGDSGALTLLAVDAVHDLALLKIQSTEQQNSLVSSAGHFDLAQQEPAKGSRLYSLGNPYDLGLTIVEGNYNGLLEKSLYDKIHFTGSINPGMSGGPTLNGNGEVVGVNVASAGNQVSFLVPVVYVRKLIQAASTPADTAFNQQIAEQLLANQQDYISKLLAQPLPQTTLSSFSLPGELANYINCWGNTQEGQEVPIDRVFYTCQTNDDIFLTDSHNSGIIHYQHELVTTAEMDPIRFFNYLEERLQYPALGLWGDEEEVTNYDCQTDFVQLQGAEAKAVFCLRAYKQFSGVFDIFMTVVSATGNQQVLQSTLVASGLSRINARAFPQAYLESFQWTQ